MIVERRMGQGTQSLERQQNALSRISSSSSSTFAFLHSLPHLISTALDLGRTRCFHGQLRRSHPPLHTYGMSKQTTTVDNIDLPNVFPTRLRCSVEPQWKLEWLRKLTASAIQTSMPHRACSVRPSDDLILTDVLSHLPLPPVLNPNPLASMYPRASIRD